MSDEVTQKVPKKKKVTPSYLEVILVALILVGGSLFVYDHYFAQKIKVVDMSGYLRQQKALLAAGEIEINDLKEGLDKVDQLLSRDAELNKNQIYILKEVVLKNGSEIDIR